ncbi:MAG: TerC family protein [Proteobacteria bacterium]|nr:TerC family protein [Pseudomonadota bacterium]NBX86255.1 TerC family protein [Pseudomonadota bacterium]
MELNGLLMMDWLGKPVWMWALFLLFVVVLLVVDLGIFHHDQHEIGVQESLKMSAAYIALGVLFGGWVWWELGAESGLLYLTGFVVEKSLAIDNVFVIAMIFTALSIPRKYQHRVLFWGILGVIVLRGVMIGVGAALVQEMAWILYIFAAFLIFSGFKLLWLAGQEEEMDINKNPLLKFLRKYGRVANELHGQKFLVRLKDNNTGHYAWYMTPLLVALLLVEVADVIFAVDSVPAIFAITTDAYLVFTSNIMAILGLRALYFALSAMMERFKYLKYALAILLIFIGSKMFIADMFGLMKFPPVASLSITFLILAVGVGYSLWKTRNLAKG